MRYSGIYVSLVRGRLTEFISSSVSGYNFISCVFDDALLLVLFGFCKYLSVIIYIDSNRYLLVFLH